MEERDQESEWAEEKNLAVMPAGNFGKLIL